jgi:hypothetical protein
MKNFHPNDTSIKQNIKKSMKKELENPLWHQRPKSNRLFLSGGPFQSTAMSVPK